jgi:acyl dehydratase
MKATAVGMKLSVATDNPRGIFDRSMKGRKIAPATVQIERGRIRFFSQVLGEQDPIHFDLDAARAAGHPDLVAPPSFFVVVEALANEERVRRGDVSAASLVKCDFRYLLHGDERYFYTAPLYAGEDVEVSTVIVDFYDKKGGAMEFVVFESTISNAKRGPLIRSRRTLLHRLPERKS